MGQDESFALNGRNGYNNEKEKKLNRSMFEFL